MTSSVNDSTHAIQPGSDGVEPYVGPRPFKREDQDIFFGRSRETLELTSLIKAHPEVLIYAQSGAGKTSLIYAQLIPTLDGEEEFDVLPPARVRSQHGTPISEDKIKNIYIFNALRDLSDDGLNLVERAQMTLAEYLKRRPRPPVNMEENPEIHSSNDNSENREEVRLPRAIIFDQFEEIFTLYPERYKDRQDFFRQVAEALEADPFLRVVFSMREDYIAELDPYIDVLPQKLSTRFRLERLRKPNARAAVTEPLKAERVRNARKFGDKAAESLVESLMMIKVKTATGEKREVPGEFVDPVQLQVVCQTLWEKLPSKVKIITEEHLKEYANVDEALLSYYENSVRKAVEAANIAIEAKAASTPAQPETVPIITEGAVRGWFERVLITREGKRNMIFRGREKTGGLQNEVVDELENQHLIRVEMRGGEPWYELSHDRFIQPIRESNQRWIRRQPMVKRKAQEFEARAVEWIGAEKDKSLLLDRAALLDAKNWRNTPEVEALGCSFELDLLIRESEAEIEHEDHKQLRLLTEAQQLRIAAEHQRASQLKIGLAVASLLLGFALAATIYAFRAEARAHKKSEEAQRALDETEIAKAAAEKAAGVATAERGKAQDAANKLWEVNKDLGEANKELEAARISAESGRAAAITARGEAVSAKTALEGKVGELADANKKLGEEKDQTLSLKLSSDAGERLLKDPELSLRLALTAESKWSTKEARYSLRQAYLTSKEHFILRGHEKRVQQGLFSPPNGRFIITTSYDSTARVWDTVLNKEVMTLKGHGGPIHAVVISSDGTKLATEAADGTARIWWLKDGSYKKLTGLTGPWPAIAFSRDGKLLATEATIKEGEAGYVVNIFDAEDPKKVAPKFPALEGHKKAVSAIAFSPTEDYLATASWDWTARIWDAQKGTLVKELKGHTGPLNSIAFDPTGKLVITTSEDGTARVWEALKGNEVRPPLSHVGVVKDAAFSPNGALILTVGRAKSLLAPEDNVVRVWDTKTGSLRFILGGHTKPINDATFSSDSEMIVTASDDGTAHVWQAQTGEHLVELKGHGGPIYSAVFSPDKKSILTAGADLTAQVWRIPHSLLEPNYFYARRDFRDLGRVEVKFISDETVMTTGTDGEVRFWNARTRKELEQKKIVPPRPEKVGLSYLQDITRSPDGRYIVMALRVSDSISAGEANMRVWDVVEQRYLDLPKHDPQITKVVYSSKGSYVLAASADGTATLWDTSTWQPMPFKLKPKDAPIPGESKPDEAPITGESKPTEVSQEEAELILDAAFDPSEKYVVTAQKKGSVQLWETATGTLKRIIMAQKNSVLSVAFNGAGNLIVMGSSDATAQVWTLDGKKVLLLSGHTRPVNDARFSPDDNFIVTASSDNTIRVWETKTGAPVAFFESLDVPVSAVLSPDNKYVVTGGFLGLGHFFSCESCLPLEEIKKLAIDSNPRELTKDERKQFELLKEEDLTQIEQYESKAPHEKDQKQRK
jgi:WD40 repeat protein